MSQYHETVCQSCETRFTKVSAIAGSTCPVCRGTLKNLPRITKAVNCAECGDLQTLEMVHEHYLEYVNTPVAQRRPIQDIFPELDSDDRELLISGTCPVCWDELFKFSDE